MYLVYGFRFEVLIARNEESGAIIGGAGLIHFGNRLFRICTSPVCPIVDIDYEDAAGLIVNAVVERARSVGAFLLQLHFPCTAERELPALLPACWLPKLPDSQAGIAFTFGRSHSEMLWIEFPQEMDHNGWREHMLRRFGRYHRKKIKLAERDGLEVFEASTEAQLRQAHSVIEENARIQGYSVQSWKAIGRTLIEQVRTGQAIMLVARYEGQDIGAHYGVLAGKRYTYALGGTLRTDRNLNAGHFLQWAAMNKARELALAGLDLTNRTNPGITNFKMGFHPECIPLIEPRYIVFSDSRYRLYRQVYPWLRRHVPLVSALLRSAHGTFNGSTVALDCFLGLVSLCGALNLSTDILLS